LGVRNATMADFTGLMQSAVLDKPVVNQTELTGKYDFTLSWDTRRLAVLRDGRQDSSPNRQRQTRHRTYTPLCREQIGLKLDATKAPADVMVIDHVEKPSEN